jgi:hypothetical protein
MPRRTKCQYLPCQCTTEQEISYCSDYCEQAAAHGFERDYCQCEHEVASVPVAPGHKKTVGREGSGDQQRYRVVGA